MNIQLSVYSCSNPNAPTKADPSTPNNRIAKRPVAMSERRFLAVLDYVQELHSTVCHHPPFQGRALVSNTVCCVSDTVRCVSVTVWSVLGTVGGVSDTMSERRFLEVLDYVQELHSTVCHLPPSQGRDRVSNTVCCVSNTVSSVSDTVSSVLDTVGGGSYTMRERHFLEVLDCGALVRSQ